MIISNINLDNLYKTLEKEKIQFNDLNGKQDINMSLNDDKTSVGYNESLNNSINLNLNQSFNSINKTSEISNNDHFTSEQIKHMSNLRIIQTNLIHIHGFPKNIAQTKILQSKK